MEDYARTLVQFDHTVGYFSFTMVQHGYTLLYHGTLWLYNTGFVVLSSVVLVKSYSSVHACLVVKVENDKCSSQSCSARDVTV